MSTETRAKSSKKKTASDSDSALDDRPLTKNRRTLAQSLGPPLDWRRLRQFLAVYERRSLGQAAGELNVTQPALSKSLRALEDELEVKLFERTPLGVVPTLFGDALATHAKVIHAELRNAQTQIAYLRGATQGHVVIGIGPSIANHVMPMATNKLHDEKPGIHLTVKEGLAEELIADLRRGEIDLAIGTWPWVNDPDLAIEVIFKDQLRVFAGNNHVLAKNKKSVKLASLLDHPWALPPTNQRWRNRLDEVFIARGLATPVATIESNSSGYLKSMITSDNFLTFLPYQSMVQEEKAGRVVALNIPSLSLNTDVTMAYRDRAVLSPACLTLMTELRKVDT